MKFFSLKKRQKKTAQKGFTLIELLVALFVFTIVAFISTSAMVTMLMANKKASVTRQIIDSISATMEDMVRDARFGTMYHCDMVGSSIVNISTIGDQKACPEDNGGSLFAFEPLQGDLESLNDQVVYRFVQGANNIGRIEKSTTGYNGTYQSLTPDTVDIQQLKFYVRSSSADSKYDRVIISVKGVIAEGSKQKTEFNLQTFVAQRLPNFIEEE